jgi:hypothetical protein
LSGGRGLFTHPGSARPFLVNMYTCYSLSCSTRKQTLKDRPRKLLCAIWVGCTPYSLAISLTVFCPLIASIATFAFTSALCRFRCISFLLLLFALPDTAILSYCPVQFPGYSIHTGCPPEHPNEGHLQDLTSGYRGDPAGHDHDHENCHYQKRARKVCDRRLPKLRMPG